MVKSFETGEFCPNTLREPAAMAMDAVNHLRRVNMNNFCNTNGVRTLQSTIESTQVVRSVYAISSVRESPRRLGMHSDFGLSTLWPRRKRQFYRHCKRFHWRARPRGDYYSD